MGTINSVTAFNHVIVVARLAGGTVWMDPTRTHQRGPLKFRQVPPYGLALVVDGVSTNLEPMVSWPPWAPTTDVHERYDIGGVDEPGRLSVVTIYRDRDADGCRARLASTQRAEWDRQCVNYYAQQYPSIGTDDVIRVEDSAEDNTITVTEWYRLGEPWSVDRSRTNQWTLNFAAEEIRGYVQQPATVLRSAPLGLPYPVDIRLLKEVHLSSGWRIEPEHVVVQDAHMRFEYDARCTNRTLRLLYRYGHFASGDGHGLVFRHSGGAGQEWGW